MSYCTIIPIQPVLLENKKHLHPATLKSIHEILGPDDFLRVHPSAIVKIEKVVSFKYRLDGDYDLHLKTGKEIRLSRTYAADFNKCFETVNRVSR